MKKVVIFHPALAPYRVDFFNSLYERYDCKFYFSYRNVQDQKFDQDFLKSQINFEPYFIEKGFDLLGRTFRFGILSIIRKEKPKIVICSEFGQVTFFCLILKHFLKFNFKLITISDDSLSNSRDRKNIRALLRNHISKNIDGVVYASSIVGEWNVCNVSRKIKPLVMPIIHEDHSFREKLEGSLSKAKNIMSLYGLNNVKIVLFVGRLVEVKNITLLLDAFSKSEIKNTKLVIVGNGPKEILLKRKVLESNIENRVLFTGRLEGKELYAWFNIASLFVLPSIYEPFGAVVNEALLAGCYTICSETAGASSLIDGHNGKIFCPYEVKELTEAMDKYLFKTQPRDIKQLSTLRRNIMPSSFEVYFEKFNKEMNHNI